MMAAHKGKSSTIRITNPEEHVGEQSGTFLAYDSHAISRHAFGLVDFARIAQLVLPTKLNWPTVATYQAATLASPWVYDQLPASVMKQPVDSTTFSFSEITMATVFSKEMKDNQ